MSGVSNSRDSVLDSVLNAVCRKDARILFLCAVICNEVVFHFDFTESAIKTYTNIFYDFSGSWRNHVERFLSGEKLYTDFYYPYPPVGFYLISFLFFISGPDIVHQSLATSFVAIVVHLGLFLLIEKRVSDEKVKTLTLITCLFFLNGSGHEVFLGGNPFPLLLGFAFFVFSLLYFDRPVVAVFLVLIAASCKHEFWIAAGILFCFFLPRNFKSIVPVATLFVLVNLLLGFNSLEVITGMGRSSWARWNFHWEGVVPQTALFLTVLLARNLSLPKYLLVVTTVMAFIAYLDIEIMRNMPLFLIGVLYLVFTGLKSRKLVFIFVVIFALQMRRGFEWGEYSFNSLLPIFFAIAFINEKGIGKKMAFQAVVLLFFISIYQYALDNTIHQPSNDKDFNLHRTKIGNIFSKNKKEDYLELEELVGGKQILTFPFCSGISLLTDAEFTSPVTYFYTSDRVRTFAYYKKEIGNPEYIVIDQDYLIWDDYPIFENTFLQWKLENIQVELSHQYPEIFELIQRSYRRLKVIDNFIVYERNI